MMQLERRLPPRGAAALAIAVVAVLVCDTMLSRSVSNLTAFYVTYGVAVAVWFVAYVYLDAGAGDVGTEGLRPLWSIAAVGAIALAAVSLFATSAHHLSVDQFQYRDFERFFRRGRWPWSDFVFTYPQGAALLFKGLARAPAWTWNALIIASQVATSMLIAARGGKPSRASLIGALAYATCPFTLIEAGVNAHLDVIVALCFALAYTAYTLNRAALTGGLFTLAATLKGWPIAIAGLFALGVRNPRRFANVALVSVAVFVVTALPFVGHLPALLSYWTTLIPIHGGSALAGVSAGPAFSQNSFFALASDWSGFAWVVKVAFLGFALVAAACVFRRCMGTLTATISWFVACSMLAAIGLYLATAPFAGSAYVYRWWTPTSVAIVRGVAILVFSLFAFFAWPRYSRRSIGYRSRFAVIVFAISVGVVLLHANTFGWYLLPCMALLCALPSGSARWLAMSALCAFYVGYPSASFLHSPGTNVTPVGAFRGYARALDYSAVGSEGVSLEKVGANAYAVRGLDGNSDLRVSVPLPCRELKFVAPHYTALMPQAFGVVVLPAKGRGRDGIEILAQGAGCEPTNPTVLRLLPNSIALRSNPGDARIRLSQAEHPSGYSVSLYAIANVSVTPTDVTALNVRRQSDADPSFGGNPIALSMYLWGQDRRGTELRVPIFIDDRTTASDYAIVDRYALRYLPQPLVKIDHVELFARTAAATKGTTIRVSDLRFVEEPVFALGDFIGVSLGFAILGFCIWWALRADRRQFGITSTEPGVDELESAQASFRERVDSALRVGFWTLNTFWFRLATIGKLRVGRSAYVDRGFAYIGPCTVDLGDNAYLGCFSVIQGAAPIRVGNRTYVGHFSSFGSNAGIQIGNDCLIGNNVTFIDDDHRFESRSLPMRDQGIRAEEIVLEDDVWIATGVTILRGVRIGRGAIVGAGAVVTKDIPPYSIAVGVPARVTRERP